jgi:hypothetical protein
MSKGMSRYNLLLVNTFKTSFIFTILCGLAACANPEHKAFQSYASATLTAGVGLDDIKLGESTLGWVVETFGQGRVAVLYGDDTHIDLEFLKGEIRFNFFVSGECQQATNSPATRLTIDQGVKEFLKHYPSCQSLPLNKLYLVAKSNQPKQTFYKGSTDQGIELWTPIASVDIFPNPGITIDITQASKKLSYIETLESISIRPGLNLYYQGATDYEIRSGQPLSEERLKELEEAKNISLQEGVVRQLSIYLPEGF